jgi:hypothetical protein
LENDTVEANCSYVTASLPASFVVDATNEAKVLSVWIKDAAGNVSARVDTNSVTLSSVTPDLASATISNSTPTNSTTYNLSYGAITNAYNRYCILENDTTESNCVYVTATLPATYTVDSTNEAKVLSIWIKNAAGTVSARVDTNSVEYDNSVPTLASATVSNATPTNTTTYNLTYGAVSGTYNRYCILENDTVEANCSYVTASLPNSFSVDVTNEAKVLSVWIKDAAGNVSTRVDSNSVSFDNVAPAAPSSLALFDPATSPNQDSTPTLQVSGVANGLSVNIYAHPTCGILTLKGTASASGATVNVDSSSLTPDGSYTFYATATDSAGNVSDCSTNSVTYVLDTSAPSLAITSPSNNSYINAANDSATFAVSGACNEAGATVVVKVDASTAASQVGGLCDGSNWSATINTTGISAAIHSLTATLSDAAANTGTSNAVSITRDVTAPSLATGLGWTQVSPTSQTSVTADWTKSGSGDLANQKIQFYSNALCSITSGSLIDLASSSTHTRSFTGTGGNTYAYTVTSIDTAGNSATTGCSSSLSIVGLQAPVVAATSPTADRTPTWTWTPGGGGNGNYRYKLDSSDLTVGATTTAVASYTPSLDLSVGVHTLYVQETDGSTWSTSGTYAVTVTLDSYYFDFGYREGAVRPDNNISATTGGSAYNTSDTTSYWNGIEPRIVGTATYGSMKNKSNVATSVQLAITGAPGVWSTSSADHMYSEYIYRSSTSGGVGNITITLTNVPAGNYDFYVYGRGSATNANGVYEIDSNGINYGRKSTSQDNDWGTTPLTTPKHYVIYRYVAVSSGQNVVLTVFPSTHTSQDSSIAGLQIVPAAPALPDLAYAGSAPLGIAGVPFYHAPSTFSANGTLSDCKIKTGTTALPTGLSVSPSNCAISGTPTGASAVANYTVVATNETGDSTDATVAVTVRAAAGFSISNVDLWLRGDAVYGATNGSTVSSWFDNSSLARSVTQTTAASRPTYKSSAANSKPGLTFAAGQFLSMTSVSQKSQVVYMVYSNSTAGVRRLMDSGSSTTPYLLSGRSGPASMRPGINWNGNIHHATATTANTAALVKFTINSASSSIEWNGTTTTAAPVSTTYGSWTSVSSSSSGSEFLGDILEIIIFDAAGAIDDTAVKAYLNTKYGL